LLLYPLFKIHASRRQHMTRIIVTGTTAKTPHTAALERGDGYFQKKYYDITLSKEGYVTEKVSIAPELNPWYIGNLLFGGLLGMLIVDPLTGSMWTFYEKDVSVLALDSLLEIPGESKMGWFNPETGEVTHDLP
jgi:hypothetical protein